MPDPSSEAHRHLPALDGIRGLAVLAVMAYHGGVLGGGFFGVDIFFVLSGYLITGLLVAEWRDRGTISLPDFWARRARRLLPALFVMILVVVIVDGGHVPGLRADAISTLFYAANWHFIAASSGYFSVGSSSPLVHTWSLAIEEQFYLVWPLVVIVLLKLRGTRAVAVAAGLGAVASGCVMGVFAAGGENLTRLYYGTDTHAQCLMVGALAAVMIRPRKLDHLLGVVGFGGLVALAIVARGSDRWVFEGGFALAALSSALVIRAGVHAPVGIPGRALACRPLRFVGRISYGLYLWHVPVFAWLDAARAGFGGLALLGCRVGVTFALATVSFVLIEHPVRTWTFFRQRVALAVGGVSLATTAVVVVTMAGTGTGVLAAGAAPTGPAPAPILGVTLAPHHHHHHRGLVKVLILGDSMAGTLGQGFSAKVAHQYGVDVVDGGDPNCALATGEFRVKSFPSQTPSPPCDPTSGDPGWPTDWAGKVAFAKPKVTVVLDRLDIVDHLFDGAWIHVGNDAYDHYLENQMATAVAVLTMHHRKVVFLTSPYYDTGARTTGAPWPEDNPARVNTYNKLLVRVVRRFKGKAFIDNVNAIVDPAGDFERTIQGVQVRFTDGIHFTYQGDWWLAPRLLPTFRAVGLGAAKRRTDVTGLATNPKVGLRGPRGHDPARIGEPA